MAAEKMEQIWLENAQRGDRLALQRLIMIHHGRLRAIASKQLPTMTQGKIEADDLLQQVYIEAFQRIAEFEYRGPGSFLGWLTRMLESRLVDVRRFLRAGVRDVQREVRRADVPSSYESLAARVALDTLTPSRILARREKSALLAAAMAGLSEDHRRAIELRFIKGCTLAEAAQIMGRSPGAVQMLCSRALRRLKESLRQLSRAD